MTFSRKLDGRTITRFDGNQSTLHFRDAEVRMYEPNLRQQILSASATRTWR